MFVKIFPNTKAFRYPKRQMLAVQERGGLLGGQRMGRGVVRRRRLVSRRNRPRDSP